MAYLPSSNKCIVFTVVSRSGVLFFCPVGSLHARVIHVDWLTQVWWYSLWMVHSIFMLFHAYGSLPCFIFYFLSSLSLCVLRPLLARSTTLLFMLIGSLNRDDIPNHWFTLVSCFTATMVRSLQVLFALCDLRLRITPLLQWSPLRGTQQTG